MKLRRSRCTISNCKARAHTMGNSNNVNVIHYIDHNHLSDTEKVTAIETKAELNDRVKNDVCKSMKTIYRDLVTESDPSLILPAYNGCQGPGEKG